MSDEQKSPIIKRIDELEEAITTRQQGTSRSVDAAIATIDEALVTFRHTERARARLVVAWVVAFVVLLSLIGGATNHVYSVNTRATTCHTLNTIRQNSRDVIHVEVTLLAQLEDDPKILAIEQPLIDALDSQRPLMSCPDKFTILGLHP